MCDLGLRGGLDRVVGLAVGHDYHDVGGVCAVSLAGDEHLVVGFLDAEGGVGATLSVWDVVNRLQDFVGLCVYDKFVKKPSVKGGIKTPEMSKVFLDKPVSFVNFICLFVSSFM